MTTVEARDGDAAISRRSAWLVAVLATAVAAGLIFTRLGTYPFWGDEADTVVFARGVWETGDANAWYGDNLYAYRSGTLLEGFQNRATPPAAYYLAAPFWGLCGDDRFALRLPFALCGLATLGLLLRWAYVRGAATTTFALLAIASALNVSIILYARQSRYYALGMLLTVLVGYLYDRYDGRRRTLWALAASLSLLAATHYLNFAGVAVALVADYALRGGRRPKLTRADWAVLVLPTAVCTAALVSVYNPIGKHDLPDEPSPHIWLDRARLLWQTVRDMNRCEYGAATVMVLAPLVALLRRNLDLFRLFTACGLFVVVTVLLSPQPVAEKGDADVRYLAPLVVPCLALTVLTLMTLAGRYRLVVVPVVVALTASNVLHVPWDSEAWRSTPAEYLHELTHPRRTTTAVLAEWLRTEVPTGASVAMIPTDWTAPSIVAVPRLRYGWQFDPGTNVGPYAELPEVMFAGLAPVDVLVVFGLNDTAEKVREGLLPALAAERGLRYELAATLDVYYDDRTRPELIWHWFRDQPYDKSKHSVYVYRRAP